jgi:hypothetical protein
VNVIKIQLLPADLSGRALSWVGHNLLASPLYTVLHSTVPLLYSPPPFRAPLFTYRIVLPLFPFPCCLRPLILTPWPSRRNIPPRPPTAMSPTPTQSPPSLAHPGNASSSLSPTASSTSLSSSSPRRRSSPSRKTSASSSSASSAP